jgi:hypothetical protein
MSTEPEREALIEELVRQYRQQLDKQLPDADQTLDQIEDIAGQVGRNVSEDIQKRLTQKQTKSPPVKRQECVCGGQARYKGKQPRQIVTLHGVVVVRRAVYYCAPCKKNVVPTDAVLGLDGGCCTLQVRAKSAYLCALLPFAQAAIALERLVNVVLSADTVERIAVAVGSALGQQQQKDVAAHQNDCLPEPDGKARRRLYIGLDGVFVPLREGWKKDGTAGDLTCRYGECKVGVVYEAAQDKNGKDRQVLARAYVATLENAEAFGPLLGTLAHQQGQHRCRDLVVLADGAVWIWQIAAKQFTGATQIVDFFHACQHLTAVADARFGAGSAEGLAWQKARRADLLADRVESVLLEIKAWQPRSEAKRKLRQTEYNYFYTNAARMRYKTFAEKGYHIGSGVVEASCKQIATQRMKLAGMHWRQETAEAILTLRAAQLSTQPPDLKAFCGMAN